jgi:nucleoside-diphosphate-sugar epimerase
MRRDDLHVPPTVPQLMGETGAHRGDAGRLGVVVVAPELKVSAQTAPAIFLALHGRQNRSKRLRSQGPDGWRVLVTGGSGFIGTNLVERLSAGDGDVINLDTRPPRSSEQVERWRQVDLLDGEQVQRLVDDFEPTHVVHLAARTDLRGRHEGDYTVNTDGTELLLGALAGMRSPPRLIAASTRMVCEIGYQPRGPTDFCPPNAYGASKARMEEIVRAAGYPGTWLITRPTSIWGPWFDVPYRGFFLAVARGWYRHPAGARVLKSFGYVGNTVEQLIGLLAAEPRSVTSEVYYLADYEPLEVGEWASLISGATGGPEVRTAPLGLLRTAAGAGSLLQRLGWSEPPLTRFRLRNLLTEMTYDLEPIQRHVPTLPFSLRAGVDRTARWLREHGDLNGASEGR